MHVAAADAERALRVLKDKGFSLKQCFGEDSTLKGRGALIDILKRDTMTGGLIYNVLRRLAIREGLLT